MAYTEAMTCKDCFKDISYRSKQAKRCEECAVKATRENGRKYDNSRNRGMFICETCNQPFLCKGKSSKKYCSLDCSPEYDRYGPPKPRAKIWRCKSCGQWTTNRLYCYYCRKLNEDMESMTEYRGIG